MQNLDNDVDFTGRSRELGLLRSELDQREPRCITVSGLPGSGASTLVRHATDPLETLRFRCPPRPDALIRRALMERIAGGAAPKTARPDTERQYSVNTSKANEDGHSGVPSWAQLFEDLRSRATDGTPFVLILDDAHRLGEARSRFEPALAAAMTRARAAGVPFHVVFAGRAGALPSLGSTEDVTAPTLDLHLGPLPLRAAAPHLPGSKPWEKIRAYGVFGGLPGVLARLDTTLTVGTNVRRLLLDDSGALADLPMSWLERSVQTPTRYIAALEVLSAGESEWADLARAIPDLTKSGQIAPYLRKLGELGFIRARRSLDAPPRSRSTRYGLSDPFLAFWLRFILPWRISERSTGIVPYYASAIRPAIRDHLQRMMPELCRRHMEIDAIETIGSNARTSGSIWNADTEIPVCGTLGNGSVYYGACIWDAPDTPPDTGAPTPLEALDASIRETRYGFGRERRIRLVFTGRSTPTWLRREVARRDDARIIDAADLLGASTQ